MRWLLAGLVAGFILGRAVRVPTTQPAQEYDPYAVPIGMPTTLPPQSLNWWLHNLGNRPQ